MSPIAKKRGRPPSKGPTARKKPGLVAAGGGGKIKRAGSFEWTDYTGGPLKPGDMVRQKGMLKEVAPPRPKRKSKKLKWKPKNAKN